MSFVVDSDTQITAITPEASAGAVDIVVLGSVNSFRLADAFAFSDPAAAPVFDSFAPTHGSPSGGTVVTVTGTDLSSVNGVSVGGVAASYRIDSDTQISVDIPAVGQGWREAQIYLRSPWGDQTHAASYIYSSAELSDLQVVGGTLSSLFNPSRYAYDMRVGENVTEVTLSPQFYGSWQSASVNGQPANVPVGLQMGQNVVPIVVTDDLSGDTVTYTITVIREALEPVRIVAHPNPITVVEGQTALMRVIATGAVAYSWQIRPAGEANFRDLVVADNGITDKGSTLEFWNASFSDGAAYRAKLTASDGQVVYSNEAEVTFLPRLGPEVIAFGQNTFDPAGGEQSDVFGNRLDEVATVTIDGEPTQFLMADANTLRYTALPHAPGRAELVLASAHGSVSASIYYGTQPAPVITNVSATVVPENSVNRVVITGSGFSNATHVAVSGIGDAVFSVDSDSQITADLPAGPAGNWNLGVTTPWGYTDTALAYHYQGSALSSILPSAGQLSPIFSANVDDYTLVVPDSVAQITLRPTVLRLGPLVNVNSLPVVSGQASQPIALSRGDSVITVGVVSADGAQTRQIRVTVTRTAAAAIIVSQPRNAVATGSATVGPRFTVVAENAVEYIWGKDAQGFVPLEWGEATGLGTPSIMLATASSSGPYRVAVRGADGNLVFSDAVSVLPEDTEHALIIQPDAGPVVGGNWVTMTGVEVTGVTGVRFGGVPATTFAVQDQITLLAQVPAGTPGFVDISIDLPGGTIARGVYKYGQSLPTVISAITPDHGMPRGGNVIVVSGQNLGAVAAIRLARIEASFTLVSPERIEAIMPDLGQMVPTNFADTTLPLSFWVNGSEIIYPYTLRASEGGLAALTISGAVLDPPFDGTTTSYKGLVASGTSEVTIKAVPRDGSTVTVNGAPLADGAMSPPISLANGPTSITVAVTAANGGDVRTYTIAIDPQGAQAVAITSHPQDLTIPIGGREQMHVGASHAAFYRWQASADGIAYSDLTSGATGLSTATITFGPLQQATALWLRAIVTGLDGTEVTSNPARLRVVQGPAVDSVQPSTGPVTGGNQIIISGSGLTGASQVSVGGQPATEVVVLSDNKITARAPAGIAGGAEVRVEGPLGSGKWLSRYIYAAPVPAPTVSAVVPNEGQAAGGTPIVITGTDFVSGASVSIGGIPATEVRRLSSTRIDATTPTGLAGAATVSVTTPSGTAELTNGFTYLPSPVIASITPNQGPVVGNTGVVISGRNFADVTAVRFGGSVAAFVINSDSQISVQTPAGMGIVDVEVINAVGSDTKIGSFTYRAAPTIASILPDEGLTTGGTDVTISGSNFTADSAVMFGTVAAVSVAVTSDTSITVRTPVANAGAVDVTVTTPFGSATETAGFTYKLPPPVIASVSPEFGPLVGGNDVVITGSNFAGVTEVRFGSALATNFNLNMPTQITARVPAGTAGPIAVTVTTPDGSDSLANGFTYVAPPSFIGIVPAHGHPDGGEEVVITGTGFVAGTTLSIGGVAATDISVDSSTQITARTPAGAVGAADMIITTPFGAITGTNAYTYRLLPPVIANVSPDQGLAIGGTSVVITGTDFADVSAVLFGNVPAQSFSIDSRTRITAVTPASANGAVDVTVTTPLGSDTRSSGFTYVTPGDFVFTPGAGALSEAMAGEAYKQPIAVTGGVAPLLYTLASGTLPQGMVLNVTTGELNGQLDENTEGSYSFSIGVRDAISATGSAAYTLDVTSRAITAPNKEQHLPTGATPLPVYLNDGATGGPFTDATISFVEPPNAGTAEVNRGDLAQVGGATPIGWYLKFTPSPGYSGTARVGYRLTSALGTSSPGVITFTLAYDPDEVVNRTHALVQGFVQSRLGMVSSNIKVPGLVERRAMSFAGERVTTGFSPSESSMVMNFATSFDQMEVVRIGEAGIVEATDIPFNAWIDGTFMLHSRDASNDRWGSFAMISAGVDYLLTDKVLVGLAFHYDRMTDPTDANTILAGNGWLLGPYASLELGSGVFWDTSVFYGGSANEIDMLSWDGAFDTRRWIVDTALSGQWRLDEVTTLTPRLRMVYLSETVEGYAITNAAGDVLSVQGFTTEQLRIGIGAALSRAFTLESGAVFTPSLDVDAGITPLNGTGFFGSIGPKLSWQYPAGATVDAGLTLNVDSSGALSFGARGGIRERF